MIRIIRNILYMLVGLLDSILEPERDPGFLQPGEIPPVYNWMVTRDDRGDIHSIPLREDHTLDSSCKCSPRVKVEGSELLIFHNSFDGREIIEEAREIIEGGKPRACDGGEVTE
jgi:hypothetical protein